MSGAKAKKTDRSAARENSSQEVTCWDGKGNSYECRRTPEDKYSVLDINDDKNVDRSERDQGINLLKELTKQLDKEKDASKKTAYKKK